MKELGIVLHGPQGPTGMGYGLEKLHEGVIACGRQSIVTSQREGWGNSMYHVVIDQPAFVERAPWSSLVPTFELPLRDDEKEKVILPTPFHRILCLNPFIRQEVLALNPGLPDYCFPLIQQGANPQSFPDVKRRLNTIGTVGKYEPRKGYDTLFPAMKMMMEHWVTAPCYAMATSPLHNSQEINELATLCDQSGVNLLPWEKSQESVMAFFSSLHIAVFPSHAEGWNLGLTEALAQGCIVVASDIHAHRWQWGLLVEYLGEEEANYRLRLVPTTEGRIIGHDRWYPGVHYVGKQWLTCRPEEFANEVYRALQNDEPPPWTDDHPFPLTWKNAAKVLIDIVDAAVNKTDE